jgi:hypothetical protein
MGRPGPPESPQSAKQTGISAQASCSRPYYECAGASSGAGSGIPARWPISTARARGMMKSTSAKVIVGPSETGLPCSWAPMMISPRDAKRKTETMPVVVRTRGPLSNRERASSVWFANGFANSGSRGTTHDVTAPRAR